MSKTPIALPEIFSQIPRHQILYPHPSPIHSLPTLTPHNPPHPQISIFAKREDHGAPLACAGNKYRKLEYIVPDILSANPLHNNHENHPSTGRLSGPATILVTEGAIQSNHTVQVSALARKLGLKALVLLSRGTGGGLRASQDPTTFIRTGNVQINRLLGAEVRILDENDPLASDAFPVLEDLRAQVSIRLGGLGYARAAFEIAEQEVEMGLGGTGQFDFIFVACGSGSTIGGLIAGFRMLDSMGEEAGRQIRPRRSVIGVLNSPTKPRSYHEERVLLFAQRASALAGFDTTGFISVDDVRLEDRFVGTGYGVLDVETKEAAEQMARMEAVVLDPVYTAKVARGMLQWIQEEEIRNFARLHSLDKVNVLFIHTGGQAALGAYADLN
ncbi:Tryptophan synthase beta subunit-like PLP-dependent enzymes superfamily [Penicillium manginii]|uniref:Tryptophan synthase beta subunit-like PLP-dependent enzymes superfamily n=1 Tax=Penicillium manginii TaxID=203109 RepID=UPI002546E439|nr:Tryptophan synthase beta subunit-like PLP-dependent enzymes superfamily [Penicillium manginii]KAJ5741761.1 Tryptophan synthase beta subunit-like PLP-dependent enzymes superfamily [Penicillium manginii]